MKSFAQTRDIRPRIFDPRKSSDLKAITRLRRSVHVVDAYANQLKELRIVDNPTLLRKTSAHALRRALSAVDVRKGKWVYYPWRSALVHILDEIDFVRLRLSRNKNLILPAEQKKFSGARIGIAGLNVGNPAALCITLEGGGREMKFADNDTLSVSNLNRFRASLADLGLNKAVLSARQVYEIDPYMSIEVLDNGIQPENIERFLLKPRIDVLVEEMDDLPLKIKIREHARKHRIPVVMVTGNGENVVIDVERFDQDQKLPLLNGYLRKSVIRQSNPQILRTLPFQKKVILARDFIGAQFLTKRLRDSFLLVGSKLAGIPQIAESSFLRGAAVCYIVRQIVTGKRVPSGRYFLRLDSIFR